MELRPATSNDINSLCDLDQLVCGVDRSKFISKIVSDGIVYLAEIDNKAVAYIALDYNFYGQGFILMLVVDSDHQREKIGTALIQYVESICKTEKMFTSTNESNAASQKLLTSLGYARSGIIYNLVDNDPELVYFKILSQ